jgi:probable rRNA maturation factor
MIVTVYNTQKDLPISVANVKLMVPFLLRTLEISTDEVIIHFVSQKAISEIHAEFFDDPSPTDCISFPIDPPQNHNTTSKHQILGEVFVCPKIALQYAKSKNLDPHQETTLYLIHGLLHLLGYDDIAPSARRKMRQMEQKCLKICEPFPLSKKRLS